MTIDLNELGEWARDLVLILREHDTPTLHNLYYYAEQYRKKTGRKWNKNMKATIRNQLQRHCRTSDQYLGKHDLFEHMANGCWRLRPNEGGQT